MWRPVSFVVSRPGRSVVRLFSSDKLIEKVGFIGLGNMGSKMSANLVKNGFKVSVNDLNESACKQLESGGAVYVKEPKNLVNDVDCLITMLPTSDNVLSLYKGQQGILNAIKPGTLVIDCSTIDPSTTVQLAPLFKSIGAGFIDAPVSGGVIAAEKGTLTFMVGGEQTDAKKAKPVLMSMGQNVIHCGPAGSGLIAKNCNNLLLAISMIGVCEAMNIGVKLGMDPKILAEVINTSSGRCWSSDTYNPVPGVTPGVPSNNEYQPGFTVKMISKDLHIVKNMVERAHLPFDMGHKALAIYSNLSKSELGDKDFSVVYKHFSQRSE